MSREKRRLRQQLPPGPRRPAIVQLIAFWTRPTASIRRLRDRYGRRVSVQLPFQAPAVLMSDPDEIKELFTAAPDVVHPGEGTRILEPIIGRHSVILLDEDEHLEQRKLMLPAFHGERMQQLSGLMTSLAEAEVASWPRGEPVALHPRLQRLTLEIILRAVFGLEEGAQLEHLRDLLTEVLAFSESPLSVLPALERYLGWSPPIRRFQRLIGQVDAVVHEVISQRRGAADAQRSDVLTMLLAARHEDGSPMSDAELRDELMTALVAGHETTASQLAWAFEILAHAPEVVEQMDDEDYLTATIYEIQRLKPVLLNSEPRLTKQPVTIGGHRYPAGVALIPSAYLVHSDPALYPDPWAFRPERFLGQSPGTYTWIAFGGGRRRCLGASFAMQEMKIVLRTVLSRCRLQPAEAELAPTKRRSITISPSRGARLVLRDRTPASRPAVALTAA